MGYVLALWGEFVKFTGGRAGLVHLLLFAAALVCCFFLGKEERHRLFWPSVLVGIFFFNPVFYKYVGTRFLSGVYWRLLWMLPWTFVIAYAVVRMAYRLGKQALRIVVVAVACVCIFVTGKPVLSAETYGERSNVYELPQAAVEIADLVQSRLVAQGDEFDNIFHSIREGVITYDADYRIHFTNLSLLKMLHLPTDVSVRPYEGLPAGSIFKIYSNGKDILREMLKEVITKGKSCQIPPDSFMQEVHSGIYFPVSGEMVPLHANGEVTGVAFSCHNVSDEEMKKRFFDLAIEESSIYPWQFDIRTNVFTFPLGFLQRFGFDGSVVTISRDDMEKTVHPEELEHIQKQFDFALKEGRSIRMSFRQHNENGGYEWWEYRTSVLGGLTADTPYSILGVCQSIQRYKTTEEELTIARDKALQADKLKSAFLANMSHEIRTPLNAIVGFSDLLSDTSAFTEEEVAQFIATINKNCSLLLALINDILDLSRIESGTMDFQLSRHSLPLLLKNVHDSQQLNMPPGVELLLDIPEGSKKYIVTDNVRLQQVVNNLINNAAKFTTSGSITFGYTEDEDGYTSLFVEDTGKGISKEGVRHIFERFYKVDNFTQGAGLGLSICQTIVERLHGTISVTSEEGKGTRFTVRLPDISE